MILLQSESPPKPAKNIGDVDIPPFGVALCVEADNANAQDSESEIVLQVRSTSGNDEEGSGTFESDFHYHNQIAFNGGATLRQSGYGHVTFPGTAPFAAAVDDASSVSVGDLLMATSSSAKLKKLDRGEPESPGDCTNIFGLFRPLKQTSSGVWLVQRLNQPMWRVKALEDGEEGDEVVCEILQQGDAGEEFETAIGKKITVVVTDGVSEDDKFLVGLIAGAIVRIGGGGGGGDDDGGGGVSRCCGECIPEGTVKDGEFPEKYYVNMFGGIEVVHQSGDDFPIVYESDEVLWKGVDYVVMLTFEGTGPEEAIIEVFEV